jgi:hypothetical protein
VDLLDQLAADRIPGSDWVRREIDGESNGGSITLIASWR